VRELIQQTLELPEASGDRFSGYAVIGQPFSSGHVLAMRCFGASSVGPAYNSVWHRDPDGNWSFYQNVPLDEGCARYFGAAITGSLTGPVRIEWNGPNQFRVTVAAPGEIVWEVRLAPTIVTNTMNAIGRALPSRWWKKSSTLGIMEAVARWVLRTGEMRLTGHTPNGHRFTASPRLIWQIAESRATIRGVDAGPPGRLATQAVLADFRIPQRGLFAITTAVLEAGPR